MGLAVMDGVRQGGLKKGSGAEAWIEHGYNPKRRSQVWNIGDAMIKAQVRKVKDDADDDSGERVALGEYGQAYLDSKLKYLEREGITPMHAHRMAQRYIEKRLLKNLWQAWRRATRAVSEGTLARMPADEITPQGVGEAITGLPESAIAPVPPHSIFLTPDEFRNWVWGSSVGIDAGGLDDKIAVSPPPRPLPSKPFRMG
jgi:hypothetical protein